MDRVLESVAIRGKGFIGITLSGEEIQLSANLCPKIIVLENLVDGLTPITTSEQAERCSDWIRKQLVRQFLTPVGNNYLLIGEIYACGNERIAVAYSEFIKK